MNQTKKRLSIINLAISMTDIETIQLQILKLGLLKTDDKIQEIIATLYETNYAKAQSLIIEYIETPHHEILQRTFQKESEKIQRHKKKLEEARIEEEKREPKSEKELVSEFDLFHAEPTSSAPAPAERTVIDLDDMIKMHNAHMEKAVEADSKNGDEGDVNFDSLLNIKSDEVMPDNISIDIEADNDFWKQPEDKAPLSESSEEDSFFNTESPEETPVTMDEIFEERPLVDSEEETVTDDDIFELAQTPAALPEEKQEENTAEALEAEQEQDISEEIPESENEEEREEALPETSEENQNEKPEENKEEPYEAPERYKAITYIDQKFKNMQVQYPTVDPAEETFDSVTQWLVQIANEGYTESDIEEILKKIDDLKEENRPEAGQLLLITAATKSKYAQFRLARALFKGDILEKNLPEAFTIINRLAVNDDYPEAICDLAQFYEHGVGIDKDKKKAIAFYLQAKELGIQRAVAHVERLNKEKKGLFSFLKG